MFNSYPIFKRVFSNQFTSKINILLFIIFFPIFLSLTIFGIITANLTIFGWAVFAIMIIYVTFYNIFFTVSFFNKDLELGVTNLEIRSGYKKSNIYLQRIFAQKSYILPMQLLFLLCWLCIGLLAGTSFIQMSTLQLIYGMLVIFIYEILVSSFLLIFASFKSGIGTTFFGVIFGILLTVMPLFSLLDAHTNSVVATTDKDYGKYKLQKYSVLHKVDQIRKQNKGGFIDGQISINLPNDVTNDASGTSNFFELFTVFDLFFNDSKIYDPNSSQQVQNVKQLSFNNERDFYKQGGSSQYVSRSYANDLIYNGLVAEFINPNLDIYVNGEAKNFEKYISTNSDAKDKYKELKKNNEVFKFIKIIDDFDKEFSTNSESDYKNSFFTLDANKNKRFSGKNGFDNFIDFIKGQTDSSELKEIIDLVNETAKFSYINSYDTNSSRSSVFDIGGSISDDTTLYAQETNLWLTTDANETEKQWLNISSDGARVFFKVYFDILREYMNMERPEYNIGNTNSESELISGEQYLKDVKLKTYINPGIMLTKLFYNSGNNKNFNNSQGEYFDPFIKNVYGFNDSVINNKRIDNLLNLNKSQNGVISDDYVYWDTEKFPIQNGNASSDFEVDEKNFLETLKKMLLVNSDLVINLLDFKFITSENFFSGYKTIGGFVAYIVDQKTGYYGEKNFSIEFSSDLSADQRTKVVLAAIKNETDKKPEKIIADRETTTKADLYKYGKNDGELTYVGSTFNPLIPLAILILVSFILSNLSWFIFNKRIIR